MANRREQENKKAEEVTELLETVKRIEEKIEILLETAGITVIGEQH